MWEAERMKGLVQVGDWPPITLSPAFAAEAGMAGLGAGFVLSALIGRVQTGRRPRITQWFGDSC